MKEYPQRNRLMGYSPHWRTPDAIYDDLHAEFGFTLDPCPLGGGGTLRHWDEERVYCNPPYNEIPKWFEKWPYAELAVFLLPSRTDTAWFHEALSAASEIRFIRGRLRFGDSKWNAPFPSVVIVFDPATCEKERIERDILRDLGPCPRRVA